MNFINEVIDYFNSIPASTWSTLGTYLAGSTIVATVLQIIKHRFSFADAKKFVTFMLGLLSLAVVLADWVITAAATNPTALGQDTAVVVGIAVFVHRFAVSPIYSKIVFGLGSLIKDANAYRATVKAPAEPAPTVAPNDPPTFQV